MGFGVRSGLRPFPLTLVLQEAHHPRQGFRQRNHPEPPYPLPHEVPKVAPVPSHQGLGASSKRACALPSCQQAAKRTLASRKRRWSLTGEGGKAGALLLGEGVLGQEFLEALFRVDL